MHLSTGAKVLFPAYCKRLRVTEAPRFQFSLLQVRSGPNILSFCRLDDCMYFSSSATWLDCQALNSGTNLSLWGQRNRKVFCIQTTLDAAQKINLVKLDPRTNCLLPRRLRGILSFRCGDCIGIGSRDVPLVNCNRLSPSFEFGKRLREVFVAGRS